MSPREKGRRIFPRFPVGEDVDREISAHLATGLLASWIPTVRGTRVDPMITMRGD